MRNRENQIPLSFGKGRRPHGYSIHFCDNGYGEMAVVIKGPYGGEKGSILLTKPEVERLVEYLHYWTMT